MKLVDSKYLFELCHHMWMTVPDGKSDAPFDVVTVYGDDDHLKILTTTATHGSFFLKVHIRIWNESGVIRRVALSVSSKSKTHKYTWTPGSYSNVRVNFLASTVMDFIERHDIPFTAERVL